MDLRAVQSLPGGSLGSEHACQLAMAVGLGFSVRQEPPDCPGEGQQTHISLCSHLFANSSSTCRGTARGKKEEGCL